MKLITESEFIEKLHVLRPDLEALEPYKGNKREILFRCKICGYEWRKKPDIIFRSKKCPSCDGKQKLTHDEFVTRLRKVSPTIVPVGEFISTKDKIRCKCVVCNTEWEPIPSNVLRGHGCPECSRIDSAIGRHNTAVKRNNFALNYPDIAKEWDYEKNGDLLPHMFSAGSQDRVWWICEKGHHYPAVIASRVNGTGCAKCLGWNKTTEEFREQLRRINPKIEVLGEYVNNRTQLLCRCTICNKEWSTRPNDLLNGHGCPACKHRKVAAMRKKAVRCIETGEVTPLPYFCGLIAI